MGGRQLPLAATLKNELRVHALEFRILCRRACLERSFLKAI